MRSPMGIGDLRLNIDAITSIYEWDLKLIPATPSDPLFILDIAREIKYACNINCEYNPDNLI